MSKITDNYYHKLTGIPEFGGGGGGGGSVTTSGVVTGNGFPATPVKIVDGTLPLDILQWNGVAWVVQQPALVTTNFPLTGDGSVLTPVDLTNGLTHTEGLTYNNNISEWEIRRLPRPRTTATVGPTSPNADYIDINSALADGHSGVKIIENTIVNAPLDFASQGNIYILINKGVDLRFNTPSGGLSVNQSLEIQGEDRSSSLTCGNTDLVFPIFDAAPGAIGVIIDGCSILDNTTDSGFFNGGLNVTISNCILFIVVDRGIFMPLLINTSDILITIKDSTINLSALNIQLLGQATQRNSVSILNCKITGVGSNNLISVNNLNIDGLTNMSVGQIYTIAGTGIMNNMNTIDGSPTIIVALQTLGGTTSDTILSNSNINRLSILNTAGSFRDIRLDNMNVSTIDVSYGNELNIIGKWVNCNIIFCGTLLAEHHISNCKFGPSSVELRSTLQSTMNNCVITTTIPSTLTLRNCSISNSIIDDLIVNTGNVLVDNCVINRISTFNTINACKFVNTKFLTGLDLAVATNTSFIGCDFSGAQYSILTDCVIDGCKYSSLVNISANTRTSYSNCIFGGQVQVISSSSLLKFTSNVFRDFFGSVVLNDNTIFTGNTFEAAVNYQFSSNTQFLNNSVLVGGGVTIDGAQTALICNNNFAEAVDINSGQNVSFTNNYIATGGITLTNNNFPHVSNNNINGGVSCDFILNGHINDNFIADLWNCSTPQQCIIANNWCATGINIISPINTQFNNNTVLGVMTGTISNRSVFSNNKCENLVYLDGSQDTQVLGNNFNFAGATQSLFLNGSNNLIFDSNKTSNNDITVTGSFDFITNSTINNNIFLDNISMTGCTGINVNNNKFVQNLDISTGTNVQFCGNNIDGYFQSQTGTFYTVNNNVFNNDGGINHNMMDMDVLTFSGNRVGPNPGTNLTSIDFTTPSSNVLVMNNQFDLDATPSLPFLGLLNIIY